MLAAWMYWRPGGGPPGTKETGVLRVISLPVFECGARRPSGYPRRMVAGGAPRLCGRTVFLVRSDKRTRRKRGSLPFRRLGVVPKRLLQSGVQIAAGARLNRRPCVGSERRPATIVPGERLLLRSPTPSASRAHLESQPTFDAYRDAGAWVPAAHRAVGSQAT